MLIKNYSQFYLKNAVFILFDIYMDYVKARRKVESSVLEVEAKKFTTFILVGCSREFNKK